jgi:hydroxyacylglutathione hydrolase
LRAAGEPTLPVRLGVERATNPFLRALDAEALGLLRKQKDSF